MSLQNPYAMHRQKVWIERAADRAANPKLPMWITGCRAGVRLPRSQSPRKLQARGDSRDSNIDSYAEEVSQANRAAGL